MKHKRLVIAVSFIAGLYGLFCLAYNLNEQAQVKPVTQAIQTLPVAKVYRHDPELTAVMDRLGLDYSELNLVYGNSFNQASTNQGFFDGRDTIYLNPDHELAITDRVISHEYIHYVQRYHYIESSEYYSYVTNLYENTPSFYARMQRYRDGSACNGTCNLNIEIEAVACTELPDYLLQQQFINYCSKYLPKRSSLFN